MSISLKNELLALKNANGLIVPTEAVNWARENEESLLHSKLEWDDEIAGEKYRVEQVRQLIAVHITDAEGSRAAISLSIDRRSGGYRLLDDMKARPDLRQIMLEDALAEFNRMQAKYQRVRELERVWAAVSTVASEHQQRPRRRAA